MGEWGIWIESAEITDVTILSSSLFKQLQCDFRDKMYEEATKSKLEVDQEIKMKQLEIRRKETVRNQDDAEKRQKEGSKIRIQ